MCLDKTCLSNIKKQTSISSAWHKQYNLCLFSEHWNISLSPLISPILHLKTFIKACNHGHREKYSFLWATGFSIWLTNLKCIPSETSSLEKLSPFYVFLHTLKKQTKYICLEKSHLYRICVTAKSKKLQCELVSGLKKYLSVWNE